MRKNIPGVAMYNVGLIGYGYWGPNLARNFNLCPETTLTRIADLDPKQRELAAKFHPHVEVTADSKKITEAKDIDIVVVATPVYTHFQLTKDALSHGKHVWVEKPMASSAEQAEEIVALAEKTGLIVLVDHTFLFTGAVRTIKGCVEKKDLGDLFYFDSVRINLGLFQHDVNVIWDLAPHDLSIMDYLLGPKAISVSATGSCHYNEMVDVAFLTVDYGNNLLAHFHLNWLSPTKVRRTILGGSKKMLIWNDSDQEEKIKIYDKGLDIKGREDSRKILPEYRVGDMFSPVVPTTEALTSEVAYLVECIQSGDNPSNDARAGLRIVKILEAADRSLELGGSPIKL